MFIPSSVQSILFEFEVSTAEKTSENTVPDELQAFMSTYFSIQKSRRVHFKIIL